MCLPACGEDPQHLYDTAQFEERQRNLPHARELYERIVREHPDSPYAQHARERLAALSEAGE
ncbi:MAG: tetratricopeptide repeat protein [Nitrospirae bacterium]|nr:MAG: tetratricopeptide repeat protein [Nitrospirota bacterium]